MLDPARLRNVLDASGDGITVQGPDGRFAYANRAAALGCGCGSVEEMLSASRAEILAQLELVDEDGQPLDPEDLPDAAVLRGAKPTSRVVGFRVGATGEQRWAIVSASPLLDADGAVDYAISVLQDITDRKRAELERDAERTRLTALTRSEQARAAELDAIIGAIGEGIVVAGDDGSIRLANRTALDILAPFDSQADLDALLSRFEFDSGRPSARDRRPRVGPPEAESARPVVEAGAAEPAAPPTELGEPRRLPGGLESGTYVARLEADPRRWVEIAAYPVAGADGDEDETILVLRDVTEAREREQARDAFIGMLSHELRTPVTTIYAGAKVLARGTALAEETRADIFEDVHGEAERLHRLVEDVVALTRLGEGALDIGSEPVLLQRFLPSVVRSEEGRWPDATFELALPENLSPVAGDATYVEQVVRNLLANAVKYAGPGSRVAITARTEATEVAVRVLDDGPGFPEADAERLFRLYYRAAPTAQKVSGSGIGLFVCSRLIEAMGGRMWAANRPAGGAEFGFALRIADVDPDDEADERPSARTCRALPRRPLLADPDQQRRDDRGQRHHRLEKSHGPVAQGLGPDGRLDRARRDSRA